MSLPTPVELLRQLVAIPSVSSPDLERDQSNRAVIDRLAEWAEHLGFRVEVVPLPQDPSKANLIATLGNGPGGFVLSGHSDTVPFDEDRWRTDPFELVEANGRLHGLGSVDMKGFFAAALHAAARFRAEELTEPLILLATADEESTMSGARALLETGRPTARRCVVGEPTDLRPVYMHKGILMELVEIEGRSGHSSNPSLGRSALEAMHGAISALLAEREALQKLHRDERFAVPTPTLNLGRIEGGDSPNRICARCSLTFDVRPLPTMDLTETRQRLRDAVREKLRNTGLGLSMRSLVEGVPPLATSADAELVRTAEAITGRRGRAVLFCTEAPFFTQLGMETIVCGAGNIEVAHQPDEYTTRQELSAAAELYARLIQRYCVETRS